MSDENEDSEHEIVDYLVEKWGTRNCGGCGSGGWNVGFSPLKLPALANDIARAWFVVYPITCSNCGNVVFINTEFVDNYIKQKKGI